MKGTSEDQDRGVRVEGSSCGKGQGNAEIIGAPGLGCAGDMPDRSRCVVITFSKVWEDEDIAGYL